MPHILLVDDDPDILDIIRLDLEDNSDNVVDACRSGAEALELAERNGYDIIITDMRMPKMNGTTLIRILREQGCHSLIVIYTGQGLGPDTREALKSGADHFVCRGGDPDKEFAELRRIIESCEKTTLPRK